MRGEESQPVDVAAATAALVVAAVWVGGGDAESDMVTLVSPLVGLTSMGFMPPSPPLLLAV